MTLETSIFAAKSRLILTPTNYSGAGTDLGEILDAEVAGVSFDYQLLTKPRSGSFWTEGRRLGANMVLTFTLAERSTAVVGLLFNSLASSGNVRSRRGTKLGHWLSAEYKKLLVLPADSGHPALYLPRSLVTEVGALTWSPSDGLHMAAAKITVVAMYEPTLEESWYYGATSDFPAL